MLETAAWRDRMFNMRAEPRGPVYPPAIEKLAGAVRDMMMPGMMGGGGGLALNQLLVVMDGIDDPPLMKRMRTKRINTWLDALYIVPRKIGKRSLRLKPPKPNKEEIYFIGACNVALERLDPALTRPGRMGRHIYFRTPTWEDRRDIFDLYLTKVAHAEALDTPRKRDELARVTNGYSPAMIDQVCSMALTYAHSDGRQAFEWEDLLEAMTTVESGVAVGQPYAKHEERSIAVHEAGHAVCSHLYADNVLSTRLSVRKRGNSGGHHQAMRVEDRFVEWRSEQIAGLIWTLGAMAAEYVFYDQTTTGVGGDVYSTTAHAVRMVGHAGMGPTPIDLSDRIDDPERREEEEERIMKRFEKLGTQIMHRSGGSMMNDDGVSGVLADGGKRRLAAALIGQSFVIAYNTIRHNREGTDYVAEPARLRRRALRRRRRPGAGGRAARAARDRPAGRGRMARDLIPPPSPAGRPGSSAEAERERARELEEQRRKQKGGLWHRSPEDGGHRARPRRAPIVARRPGRRAPRRRATRPSRPRRADTPFRSRFGLVLGALLGLGIATLAIGAAVYVGTTGNGAPDGWSGWKPTADDGEKAAQQIATHVGRKYRLADGNQIVGVAGRPARGRRARPTVPLEIAIQHRPAGRRHRLHRGQRADVHAQRPRPEGLGRAAASRPRSATCCCAARRSSSRSTRSATSTTSTSSSRCCRRRRRMKTEEQGRRDAPRRRPEEKQTQALFFRPGDLEPQLEIPLARDDPAAHPAAGDDPGVRGPPHRRAHAQQPVPRLLPAGPGPEGVPRAGPPTR